ncbi:MAG: EAL domain-containing protein [Myxococcales bacterium]|nr:EAL domain-containing protein [Myxococcales bacterium]
MSCELQIGERGGPPTWHRVRVCPLARDESEAPNGFLLVFTEIRDEIEARKRKDYVHRKLRLFAEIATALARAPLRIEAVFSTLATKLSAEWGDLCLIFQRVDETLRLVAWEHPDPDMTERIDTHLLRRPLTVGKGLTARVFQTGRPVLINSGSRGNPVEPDCPLGAFFVQFPVSSTLLAPIPIDGRIRALLCLARASTDRPFSPRYKGLVQTITNLAGMVLEKTHEFEETRGELVERRRLIAQQRAIRERFELAARGAADGLWDWDVAGDRFHASPRWCENLGLYPRACDGSSELWLGRIHAEDRDWVEQTLGRFFDTRGETLEIEHRILHTDTKYRWVRVRAAALRHADGSVRRLAGSMTDITAVRESEQSLRFDALHDDLTGLPNRSLVRDRLQMAIHRIARNPSEGYAVLFVDLDGFKRINDWAGHLLGDELLRRVAERLCDSIRTVDTVGRYGGDEFVVLVDHWNELADVLALAQRIIRRISEPIQLGDDTVGISCSIGIAIGCPAYLSTADVLADADAAMYQAKQKGPGSYHVYGRSAERPPTSAETMREQLRPAIREHQFLLHYQPVINCIDGRIAGFEALLRWRHPELGMITPRSFLEPAIDSGALNALEEWSFHDVCQQLASWRREHPALENAWVSVNLSPRQLARSRTLTSAIEGAMRAAELPAESLVLELTDFATLGEEPDALPGLNRLSRLELPLCVDDFGLSGTSLSDVLHLPIFMLKIARQLTDGLGFDENAADLVRSILSLAETTGIKVIAKMIDKPRQMRALRELDCTYVQGNLFCPPKPALLLRNVLADWPARELATRASIDQHELPSVDHD